MIRRLLDGLYRVSGYVAAFFLAAIAASIIAQVGGRFVGFPIDAVEISGFFLAGATYFGLAYTLNCGAHIRINLMIRHFSGPLRRAIELWCCGVGTLALAFFSLHAVQLFLEFFRFGDRSRGLYAVPFWIPELGMTIGVIVLTIAFADQFVRVARGETPRYEIPIESTLDTLVSGAELPTGDVGRLASADKGSRADV